MKRISQVMSGALLLAVAAFAAQAQPARFVEGTHYDALPEPVRTADPDKVEVAEVFWYGCGHCYAFEPLIDSWSEDLASDVAFVRSPGMWNELMEVHAQVFYTEEALDVKEALHGKVFEAIHQDGNYLQTQDEVRELFLAHTDITAEEFDRAWASFGVTSAVKAASARMRAYGVRGVPSIVVNGKYRVSTSEAVQTQADMLEVADFLVEMERNNDS